MGTINDKNMTLAEFNSFVRDIDPDAEIADVENWLKKTAIPRCNNDFYQAVDRIHRILTGSSAQQDNGDVTRIAAQKPTLGHALGKIQLSTKPSAKPA